MNATIYKEIKTAIYMSFRHRNKSAVAKKFCNTIIEIITTFENRKRRRRTKDQISYLLAIEIILADLMLASARVESGWCFRSLCNDKFTNEDVGRATFRNIIKQLVSAGLVETLKGGNLTNLFHEENPTSNPFYPGLACRFRATATLLLIAFQHGINTSKIRRHYATVLPRNVIQLRAESRRMHGRRIGGQRMTIEKDDMFTQLEQQVRVINVYLVNQQLEGAIFNGYYRGFNCGNHPDFQWNKGGRLYSLGADSYQKLKQSQRLKEIKINGESVIEIDVNASYLTIYFGICKTPLPKRRDLYNIKGLHREIVKAWVKSAFGIGKLPNRWPSSAKKELISKGIDLRGMTLQKVGERVCRAIPILAQLPDIGVTWAELMFLESQAIISAIDTLRESYGIPAYSMHDGIIVPSSAKNIAPREIVAAYQRLSLECRTTLKSSK